MRVLCFQDWGVPLIKNGTKYSTIRRKANCQPGDTLSLRYWDGKPRRKGSRQVEFARVVCRGVKPITIMDIGVKIGIEKNGMYYLNPSLIYCRVAAQEGFISWLDMKIFFESHYGLPFFGEMIEWEPLEGE